jgi:hypothetical protein
VIGQMKIGEASATLPDGTVLTLRADHEALILAEDAAGVGIETLFTRLQDGRMGATRALLFGLLQHHHPNITRGAAATLAFDHGAALMPAVSEALAKAFPEAAAKATAAGDGPLAAAPAAQASGGGKNSSKAGAKRG